MDKEQLRKKAEEITTKAFTNHEQFPEIYVQWVDLIESELLAVQQATREEDIAACESIREEAGTLERQRGARLCANAIRGKK